mmetsp:Transcript_30401/g.98194  ORF Transcript_30401/g.98194 Transcript_30401/m.98194 type:complete len:265 (-) Transcript_30401:424-1218(-)
MPFDSSLSGAAREYCRLRRGMVIIRSSFGRVDGSEGAPWSSAPKLLSRVTTCLCANCSARLSGVLPSSALALTSTPLSASQMVVDRAPAKAAACSGVQPRSARACSTPASGLTSCCTVSQRATSTWPPKTATWIGCQPPTAAQQRSTCVYCWVVSQRKICRWPPRAAKCSGSHPTMSCTRTFAPSRVRTSHCTSSKWPLSAAKCSRSWPEVVTVSMGAPLACRKRATCACPASTAQWMGCHPDVDSASLDAPDRMSHSATPAWP